jgi:hypothetical protein
MIIDEIATISALFLVEISLRDSFVGEKLILSKLKDQSEARSVEILHSDISEKFQGLLVSLCYHLREGNLILHGRQPEFWNTGHFRLLSGVFLLLLTVFLSFLVLPVALPSLNFSFCRLGGSIDDGGTFLVQGGKLLEEFLLELQNLLLELRFKLCVGLLYALKAGDATTHRSRQRFNVAG